MLSISVNISYAIEKVTYYHTDGLGSPVAGTDENGVLLWKEDYLPYGGRIRKQIESSANDRWYTGHPEDNETGLNYTGARYYDSITGRFLAIDSVGVSLLNPQSFNRYVYANNNPYRYIDPDGNNPASAARAGYAIGEFAIAPLIDLAINTVIVTGGSYTLGTYLFEVFNEDASDSAPKGDDVNVDDEIDKLIDGLENEKDSRGRDRRGNYVDPDGNADDALDGLTGEPDNNGGKILPDGSRAGVHDSTGRSGGKAGENTGSRKVHINRPKGKQDIKIRYKK